MKRSPMRWWKLAPALLLAGMMWSGPAAADDGRKGDFNGPGGLSGPADPDRPDRSQRLQRGGKRGAQGRHGRMGAGMRGHRQDVMAKLNLSDRQKEQIQGIRQENQRRMIPIHARLQEAGLDLRQLMQADRPNQAQIDATIDRLADLRADAHKARVATMLEVQNVLTDAQRKQLKEQRGTMRGMRGGGKRHDGGGMRHDNSGAPKVRGASRGA